jgi:uncharacterized protein (TIGR02001 family)
MMKLMKSILAASMLSAVVAAPAFAQEEPALGVSFNIGAFSDYVFRGVSQTDENPAVQGGADISYGLFYAGVWASNVDFNTAAESEVDLYIGVKPSLGPIDFDLGVVTYIYPDEDTLNATEFKAVASHSYESGASIALSYFYSPEYGKDGPTTNYVELGGSVPLTTLGPVSLSAIGAVGSFSGDGAFVDYTNWKVGLAGALENGVSLELSYTDTDLDNSPTAEGRVFLGVKFSFSGS